MIDADDDAVRAVVREQLMTFVLATRPRSVADGSAVLGAFLAEAALGLSTSVGTDATLAILERVQAQLKERPHLPPRPPFPSRRPANDPKATP